MSNDITTTPATVELLEREIRATRNSLMNQIVCRRDHPSYGYTKAGILTTLARLEGMLVAHHIVTAASASATWGFDSLAAAQVLDIDLTDLRLRAANS
jgi:hypothetical protein